MYKPKGKAKEKDKGNDKGGSGDNSSLQPLGRLSSSANDVEMAKIQGKPDPSQATVNLFIPRTNGTPSLAKVHVCTEASWFEQVDGNDTEMAKPVDMCELVKLNPDYFTQAFDKADKMASKEAPSAKPNKLHVSKVEKDLLADTTAKTHDDLIAQLQLENKNLEGENLALKMMFDDEQEKTAQLEDKNNDLRRELAKFQQNAFNTSTRFNASGNATTRSLENDDVEGEAMETDSSNDNSDASAAEPLIEHVTKSQPCSKCQAKDVEIGQLLKQIAELTLENQQLKAGQIAKPIDEKHEFEWIAPQLDNAHWGSDDQEAIDAAIVDELPHFTSLLRFDGRVAYQFAYMDQYDEFSNFKKILFHQFVSMIESMMRDPDAKKKYADLNRVDTLRLAFQMSNIENDPSSPNDCLLADKELRHDPFKKASRPMFPCITYSISTKIVARFVVRLKFGVNALTDENKLQASHTCGNGDCIWHIIPETATVNQSRDDCHNFGCAKICPHRLDSAVEPCTFQRDGVYLPCRNDPELEECIDDCTLDCFQDVDIAKIQSKKPNPRKRKSNNLEASSAKENNVESMDERGDQNEDGPIPYTEYFTNDSFGTGMRGNPQLTLGGCKLNIEPNKVKVSAQDKFNSRWKCSKKEVCKGRALTIGDENGYWGIETVGHTCN